MANSDDKGGCCGCFVYFAFMSIFGGFFFDYALWVYFGKDVPWYCDMLIGCFIGPLAFVAGMVGFILKCGGVAAPFFGG